MASPGQTARFHGALQMTPCRLDWMNYITRMTQANRKTTTSDRLTTVLSYGALLLLGYLVFLITAPFLIPLAWSAVLAIFFYPVYLQLERRFSPTWAAVLCTLGVTFLLIVPVLTVMLYAAREAIEASAGVRENLSANGTGAIQDFFDSLRRHLPESLQGIDLIGRAAAGHGKSGVVFGRQHRAAGEERVLFYREPVHSPVRTVLHVSRWRSHTARGAASHPI